MKARDLVCYWCAVELGIPITDLAKGFDLSPPAVSYAVGRGEKLVNEKQYVLG